MSRFLSFAENGVVEGYFHNVDSQDKKITGVRFYGTLIEEDRFSRKKKDL